MNLWIKTFVILVGKDTDVNEHERLPVSNIALGHKIKERHFYCCSTSHSHGSVFHNEHNSYPLMSAKWTLVVFITLKDDLICYFHVQVLCYRSC